MKSRAFAILGLVAVALVAGWIWVQSTSGRLPPGFAQSNGRIEAERIDISTRFGGRLAEITVAEGDRVAAGQVVARLDSTQLQAQLREAGAGVRAAEQGLAEARAVLAERESGLTFARQELFRAESLQKRGHTPAETVDLRRTQLTAAEAAVASAKAGVATARARIEAAQATVDRLDADLDEYALTAPRAGRVQYRLAEPGEVLSPGARVVTLLDLTDVSMTIYLPTAAAGRLAYGAQARIVFDAAPHFVVPATVSFVAGEAQFTPKYVETAEERENLMFRVKLTLPPEVLRAHQDIVKTGVPGVATVQVDPAAQWPGDLAVRLPDAR
ncbi:HlyD family secretion protein [Rhodovulum imhoffii]|uniref:HlyD family secretion protein n=1 Tax=Rhodovulum imhoffii TaxID=365340 RepID=A0A2T5BUI6_9RHOB|nr:HlyD family efflux transporter periplasmic adaptor subunit [Rhodovulum imhoffii]MBK5934791.1 efflux transporter periplasmic adaptor subunit [Rhodovulum imhoffii]PTN03193.1 HlyD family secretion protein [Rhodovulum imhoffii]